jgi:hypothetical protein
VTGQLIGLLAGVAVLTALETAGNPEAIVPVWAAVHSVHVALRNYSLKTLRFPYPNMKRATALAVEHVASGRVLTLAEANATEPIWQGPAACCPRVELGCSIEDAVTRVSGTTGISGNGAGLEPGINLAALLDMYAAQSYMLTWHEGVARVVLWENAQPRDMMRAIWQAAWLEREGTRTAGLEDLRNSVTATEAAFPSFCKEAERQGWLLERTKLPVGPIRLQSSAAAV